MNHPPAVTSRIRCTYTLAPRAPSPLCRSSLPSDIFIFNWRVITFTHPRLWKHLRERMHPPSLTQPHPLCFHRSSRIRAPQSTLALVARKTNHAPPFCLFCNKMGCFPLLLQKNSPKTLHWGLWHFHVLTFGWRFIYICYSMLWTSKRMREGLLC